jgi:predicted transcriptional regulator
MDDQLDRVLGPLEAKALRVLWSQSQPMSVREVLARLNQGRRPPLAYTTVMTVLSRLADKEIVRRTARGRSYEYEAVAKDAAEIAVRSVVRDFGDAAVAHLVSEVRDDPKLLRRLRRLLDER